MVFYIVLLTIQNISLNEYFNDNEKLKLDKKEIIDIPLNISRLSQIIVIKITWS